MIINYSPQLRNATLTLSKQGEILTINGTSVDLSPLQSGYRLPYEECQNGHPFLMSAERSEAGELAVTVLLPHGKDATQTVLFPVPTINPQDGNIEVPE